jgi:hypothetical protein
MSAGLANTEATRDDDAAIERRALPFGQHEEIIQLGAAKSKRRRDRARMLEKNFQCSAAQLGDQQSHRCLAKPVMREMFMRAF